jgi:DNA-binding SARP family transcriptional activator
VKIEIRTLGDLAVFLDGAEVEEFVAQPVRTALLVFLAVEREATRESAMALLWPERDSARARHALSQTLYELKRSLGDGWIKTPGSRLRTTESVQVDALEFTAAVEEGAFEPALDLYRGPFLEGWHLTGSAEFEDWVDGQRRRLANLYGEACRQHATESLARGDPASALATARRWVEAEPLEAEAQHRLIRLLADGGDPQGALRQYRRYERRLEGDDLEPLPETRRLLERIELQLRGAGATRPDGDVTSGPRIAVLPFEHHGPDENRPFTDGFADELRSELSRIPGVAVTARASALHYASRHAPLAQIGEALGVAYVVRGSIRWEPLTVPPRIRISPNLARVADAVELWSEDYDVEFAAGFEVEPQVAEQVRQALGLREPAEDVHARRRSPARDREAYELYLEGLQYANHRSKDGLETAAALFQQALKIQPDFARAYAGLAQVYSVIPGFTGAQPRVWYLKAKLATERAMALDPQLAEAHFASGFLAFHLDWNMAAAEEHLNRCLELAPSFAAGWVRLGYLLCALGRFGEAREAAERGLALDPLSVATNFDTGYQFWQLRDREAALRQFRRVEQLDPDFDPAHFFIGADHFERGDVDGVRREWSRIQSLGPLWQSVLERLHHPDEVIEALDRMTELAPGPVHYLLVSAFYTLFGAHDRALRWLEGHAHNVRDEPGRIDTGGPSLTHIIRDPLFDPLRSDERFRALIRRMGAKDPADIQASDTSAASA